ncbi:MAG: asparaginase [Microbacteriaceae bacterium]
MSTPELPHVVVVAMGGTIAGSASTSTDTAGYRAATTGVDEVLSTVPEIRRIARISTEQFAQIDSSDVTDDILLALARRVDELACSPDIDGVVITHGTDTLEETAYFLHLVLSSTTPVVLVGSMRPASSLSADGPMNIFAAVAVAASPLSRDRGVLIVMNDAIHSARDVTKSSSMSVHAFESPHGPLGTVIDGHVVFYRLLARPHTAHSEFCLERITKLPAGAVIYAHTGITTDFVDRIVGGGYAVIVHAGFGNGMVPQRIVASLERARAAGALIVRASRSESAQLTAVGASDGAVNDWIAALDQNPPRARILACLALTETNDPSEIQSIFHRY